MKKRIVRLITLFVAIACIAIKVNAQDADAKKMKMTPEQRTDKRVEGMKKRLNLTDAQIPKMRELILAQEKNNEADMKEKQESRKKMIDEMQKILTPEQMAKFKENQEKRMEKKKEMHKEMKEKHKQDK